MSAEEIGVAIGVGTVYVFNEWRKYRDARKAKRGSSLDDNLVIDSKIYPILWDLITNYNAIRVYITQFHNGSDFYTGQSIQRMTVHPEVAIRNVAKIKPTHDNIPISSMMHRVLMEIKLGGLYTVDNRDNLIETIEDDRELKEWMTVYDSKSLYYFKIEDKTRKDVVAVLNIHWNHRQPINHIQVAEIQEIIKKLETIFDKL